MKFTSFACFVVCFMCLLAVANDSFGQKFLAVSVTLMFQNVKLTDALDKISANKHIKFAYADNVRKPDFKVSLNAQNKSI